jgi:hypothetical protein
MTETVSEDWFADPVIVAVYVDGSMTGVWCTRQASVFVVMAVMTMAVFVCLDPEPVLHLQRLVRWIET